MGSGDAGLVADATPGIPAAKECALSRLCFSRPFQELVSSARGLNEEALQWMAKSSQAAWPLAVQGRRQGQHTIEPMAKSRPRQRHPWLGLRQRL